MAELVDAPDLGSGVERRGGSSPPPGTTFVLTCLVGLGQEARKEFFSSAKDRNAKIERPIIGGNPFLLSLDRFT